MDFAKLGNVFIVRLDKGEEIVESLKQFCKKHHIKAGLVSGIGAASKVKLKFFFPENKKYEEKTFFGNFEILSLAGNISQLNKAPFLHLHITLGDLEYDCIGGHLTRAVVSATFEASIFVLKGRLERSFDEKIGLNLFKF